jgi:tetratricopeptide (TPR) repeat protein
LTSAEQMLFRRLAIFAGGCRLDEATRICSGGEGTGLQLLELETTKGIASLVDVHLLRVLEEPGEPLGAIDLDLIAGVERLQGLDPDREPRYGFLETIHAYAREQLEDSGEAEQLRHQHALTYLALAEQADPALRSRDEFVWLERLERELDNFRAVLDWTVVSGPTTLGLEIAGALYWFWLERGYFPEGVHWLDALLTTAGFEGMDRQQLTRSRITDIVPRLVLAKALRGRGYLAMVQLNPFYARSLYQDALGLIPTELELQTDQLQSSCTVPEILSVRIYLLAGLALCALFLSDGEEFATYSNACLALGYQLREDYLVSVMLYSQSGVARAQGDVEQADNLWKEAVRIVHQIDNPDGNGLVLAALAKLELMQGNVKQALIYGRQALAQYYQLGSPRRISEGVGALSEVAAAAHLSERSALLLGAADAIGGTVGIPTWLHLADEVEFESTLGTKQFLLTARGEISTEAWDQAYLGGQSLSIDTAVGKALEIWEAFPDSKDGN